MKIAGIGVNFPRNQVNNTELLETIAINSRHLDDKSLKEVLILSEVYLEKTNSHSRYWTSETDNLQQLTTSAARKALCEAGLHPYDVDLVIYAAVNKFFNEPGDSYFVAEAIGAKRARCFDVLDACNSWVTAAFLVEDLMKLGRIKNALIVSAEFSMIPGGHTRPSSFCVGSVEEVGYKFPMQTVGDVVTATVLTNDGPDWRRCQETRPEFAGLCFVPTRTATSFLQECGSFPHVVWEANAAISFGKLLYENGAQTACNQILNLALNMREVSCIVPHTSGERTWRDMAERVSVSEKMFYIYRDYGNVVSSSFPLGFYLAKQCGKTKSGDQIVGWIAAAGMSFTAFAFIV